MYSMRIIMYTIIIIVYSLRIRMYKVYFYIPGSGQCEQQQIAGGPQLLHSPDIAV